MFTDDSDAADVKLVDFGFARVFSDLQPLRTPCFTLTYAAPEVSVLDTVDIAWM